MVSRDGGESFISSNQGFSHRQVSALAQKKQTSLNTIYIAVAMDREHGGFFFSEDGGDNWSQFNDGLGKASPWITSILASEKSQQVFLGTRDGIYAGTPGISAWKLCKSTSELKINQIAYADPAENFLLIAADNGLFRLNPGTDKKSKLKTGIYEKEISSVITVGDKSYAGTKMGVFSSTDLGITWKIDVKGLPFVAVNSFASAEGYLYCTTDNGIYRLDLNGSSWEPGNLDHDQSLSIASAGSPSSLFSADLTNGYFFFSRDRGHTWSTFALGQMISHISSLSAESANYVLAGTISEGLVRIQLPEAEQVK
jgi:photosystem II stability/assembly factor-like uncharacterized protein